LQPFETLSPCAERGLQPCETVPASADGERPCAT
jgi:hypothetical protein